MMKWKEKLTMFAASAAAFWAATPLAAMAATEGGETEGTLSTRIIIILATCIIMALVYPRLKK